MKVFIVVSAIIATASCGSLRSGRQGWSGPETTPGWTTVPPTTLPPGWPGKAAGWSTTLPPTTQGWTTLPPTPAGWTGSKVNQGGWGWSTTNKPSGWPAQPSQGWNAPSGWNAPNQGWGSNTNIALDGALAAAGSGWAAENHADDVVSIGGWGVPASLQISSNGDSVVSQDGQILQVTSDDTQSAASLNNVAVGQQASASEGQALDAAGLEVSNQQSGWAAAAGEGSSAAEGESILNVNNANLGMAHE